MKPEPDFDAITRQREEAWVGDAVLGLFVREWILRNEGRLDGSLFIRFTSNDFLATIGNPTAVEAEIGRIYSQEGLEAAYYHVEEKILPAFIAREKNRSRQLGTRKGRKSSPKK